MRAEYADEQAYQADVQQLDPTKGVVEFCNTLITMFNLDGTIEDNFEIQFYPIDKIASYYCKSYMERNHPGIVIDESSSTDIVEPVMEIMLNDSLKLPIEKRCDFWKTNTYTSSLGVRVIVKSTGREIDLIENLKSIYRCTSVYR